MIIGAAINAAAIVIGGGIGLLLKGKIKDKFTHSIIKVLGLCVFVIGASGAINGDIMLLVVSLTLGTFAGELIGIDENLNKFGLFVQNKLSQSGSNSTFAEGFVMTTLLYCVGAMAIVGSIDAGLRGEYGTIFTKSVLDGVSAIIFASTMGVGVLFSGAAVLVYQGSIEFFAGFLQHLFTPGLITQISAVGGVMILAISFNMVLDTKLKVANMLPSFLFSIFYYFVFF